MSRLIGTPKFIDLLKIDGVSSAALDSWMDDAEAQTYGEMRADSKHPGEHIAVDYARLAVRHTIKTQVHRARVFRADNREMPKHREIELYNAICDGLGLHVDGGRVVSPSMRADSRFFAENVTSRATTVIRPSDQPDVVRQAIGVRPVEPTAEYVDLDYLGEAGKAALITPEQRTFPVVSYDLARDKNRMFWFGVATRSSWSDALYSAVPSAVNKMQEDARMARRALERFHEEVLIRSCAGISAKGLAQSPIPRILSTVDFSTASLGEKTAEMRRLLQRVRSSVNFAGAAPSVGLVDQELAYNLRNSSNIDAGGSLSGDAIIMAAMAREGLTNVIEAPTMTRWFASPRGPNYAQMLIWAPNVDGALRQLVGLTPSPVSTAEHHGTEILWAMRLGLIEIGDLTSVAILDIKIR